MTPDGGAIDERVRQLERRLELSERDRQDIWRHLGMVEKSLAVIDTTIHTLHKDIGELTQEIRWVRRGLWAAAGSFSVLIVAIASVVLNGGA